MLALYFPKITSTFYFVSLYLSRVLRLDCVTGVHVIIIMLLLLPDWYLWIWK